MRPRNLLILLAAVVVVALVMLSFLDQLLVDYLWYGRLGYGGVFNTTVGAEIAIFLVVWLVAFAAIFVSGLIAIGGSRNHERLRVVRRPDEMVEVNLPALHCSRCSRRRARRRVGIRTSRDFTGCRSESSSRRSATTSAFTSSPCRCSRKSAICS